MRTCLSVIVILLQSAFLFAAAPGSGIPVSHAQGNSAVLQTYTDISAEQARALVDSGLDLLFLDVRTPGEYEAGHITEPTDALNMPLGTYLTEHHEELPDKPIIVYCASGSRSRSAAEYLVNNGHTDIYNMLGGYSAWVQLPTRTPTPTVTSTPTPTSTPSPPTPTPTVSPSATPPPGDLDRDGTVDQRDLLLLKKNWHKTAP